MDLGDADLEGFVDGAADLSLDVGEGASGPGGDLGDDVESVGAVLAGEGDGGEGAAAEAVDTGEVAFDVGGYEVAAPEDDQVLEAIDDEEFAVDEVAEVAGVDLVGVAGGAAVVPGGGGGAGEADFADVAVREEEAGVDVADAELVVGDGAADGDEGDGLWVGFGDLGGDVFGGEEVAVDAVEAGRVGGVGEGDGQGGFGEAVDGVEGLPSEAEGGEATEESFDRAVIDGFAAVEGQAKVSEVEVLEGVIGEFVGGDGVGEVGSGGEGGLELGEGSEPGDGVHDELHGAHQVGGGVEEDTEEGAADQAHVVVEGEPGDAAILGGEVGGQGAGAEVRDEVAVGDDDAFGGARAARGVLKVGDVLEGADQVEEGGLGGFFGEERVKPGGLLGVGDEGLGLLSAVGDDGGRGGVGVDGLDALAEGLGEAHVAGRGEGDGDGAEGHGAEKPGHEVTVAFDEEEDGLSVGDAGGFEVSCGVAGLGEESLVGDRPGSKGSVGGAREFEEDGSLGAGGGVAMEDFGETPGGVGKGGVISHRVLPLREGTVERGPRRVLVCGGGSSAGGPRSSGLVGG